MAGVDWGDWKTDSENGMRVGLEVDWSAVTTASATATATVTVHTENRYKHNDSQTLNFSGGISGSVSYTNSQGSGTTSVRATKTYTYTYSTFGSSPGSVTLSATLSGHYRGLTPTVSKAYAIPGRPYSAPATPSVSIYAGGANCSGNQTNSTKDKFWQYTDWELETNDVWGPWQPGAPGSQTSKTYTGGVDSRMRARVRANNANATGAYGTSGYYYGVPDAISGFSGSRAVGATTVNLSWTNNARYPSGFRIQRSLNGGAFAALRTVSGSTTSTTDTIGLADTAQYRVYTEAGSGATLNTSTVSSTVSIGLGYNPPAAPLSATLARVSDAEALITLTGNQNNAGADQYWSTVEWQLAVGAGAYGGGAAGLAGTTTSINVSGLVANQRYRARARAVNVSGAGPWLETSFIYTTPTTPINPVYERTTQVELSVTQLAPWAELIRVERSTNSGASWAELGTYGSGEFFDPLPPGSAAWYRFRVQTPTPVMQSGYSTTLVVNALLSTDKARMPGVTRIYQASDRIRQVLVGATRIWTDGD